jgi:hypothetical protein
MTAAVLADLLLVDAGHRELRRALHLERDALRRLDQHRVAVAEGELEVRPLGLHPVTDAVDLQALLVALGDPDDDVVHQRPGEAVQRAGLPFVVRALHQQRTVVVALDGDRLRNSVLRVPFGPLTVTRWPSMVTSTPGGDGDRQLTDA